ncbi:MAG: ArnT family glycosyltransferase [Janthinobacterium lividum]
MKAVFRLTASSTRALPRSAMFALCIIYAATGLFGRDPWKNEDAAGFGVMWTMAHGHLVDWILPNLVGKPMPEYGPLGYWLSALSIRAFEPLLGAPDAARLATAALFLSACALLWYGTYLLGRRAEVQPFKYAFGGEPLPRDYGRTIADGAVLILLACFGLAERGHETTPQLAQFACVAMVLYGIVRGLDKPVQGALWWGAAIGLLTLSANPVLAIATLIFNVVSMALLLRGRLALRPMFGIGLPIAALVALSWPLLALRLGGAAAAASYLHDWAAGNFDNFGGPDVHALAYAVKNLPLYTWPAWPLAIWSWWSWGGLRRAPHVVAPLAVAAPLIITIVLQNEQTNRLFVLLLPPLAMLAAFSLPTLKRGAVNAIDWFALLSFTILGGFVWLVWLAGLTGFPYPIARNLSRLVPGFQASFNPLTFAAAIVATGCWMVLVRWRLARHPVVLWRSVVLSSAGTTLMWILLMTLWLPVINYSRTYRDVALQISAHLPNGYRCVTPVRLGDAQIASFAYFAKLRFTFAGTDCDVLLRQDTQDFVPPGSDTSDAWRLVWQGRRAADRDENFAMYVRRTPRAASAAPEQH